VIRRLTAVLAGLAALLLVVAGASASTRGAVSVLAPVPSPGFPALPHVIGDQIYEGTYSNPLGDQLASRVDRYTATGTLEQSYVVTGQDLSQPHGVQVAANDAAGRLLLLDKTSGRIISLDPQTGAQTLYSRVPDLALCTTVAAGAPCSPALVDQAPMPDYAAWGPDGSLYVTDYQQAVIWRIGPGGGNATIWLADRRLDGGPFGTGCIALLADHHTLLFDQASNGGLGSTSATTGKLYEVAIGAGSRPGALRQIWESAPGDAPDGCAVTTAGHIFVALVGGPNQIVELDSAGHELARFGQAITGANGSSVPFDSPSGLAFDGTQLIVANQSYFAGNAANQVLLSLQTGESAQPTFVPAGAGTTPTTKPPAAPKHKKPQHKKKPKHKKKHKQRHKTAPKRHHDPKHGRDTDGGG
jgi:sugar lactone lactonase YvrE